VLYALITYATMYPTWPSRLSTRIPDKIGDNLLLLWTLRWAGRHWTSGWNRLWDAPIFWPRPNALAFTESMLPIAIVHRALALVLRSDVLAYNLIYLAAGFAAMLGVYLLALRITGSVEGAFVAGLVFGLATPRLVQYQHFQLLFVCFVPFVILLTMRYFTAPSVSRGAALGITTGLLFLSSGYYAVMTAVALLVIVPGLIVTRRELPVRRVMTGLIVAALCAAALAGPVALKYAHIEAQPGFTRYADPTFAAHPSDFVRVPPDNRILARAVPIMSHASSVENYLFSGLVACILGAIGLAVFLRRSRSAAYARCLSTQTLALCCAASLLLLVMCFGSYATIAGRVIALPYKRVENLPGFGGIRVTSRFFAFPLLTLAVLGALGLARILAGRPHRQQIVIVAACAVIVLIETSIPLELQRVPDATRQAAVNAALAQRAPGPVIELPMVTSANGGDNWAEVEMPRLWLATIDGHPRVNGYSGAEPPGTRELAKTLDRHFPSAPTVDHLAAMGVRYVVVHFSEGRADGTRTPEASFTEHRAQEILARLPADRAQVIGRFGAAYLIEIRATRTK
jgi:hypothetical protein